MVLYFGVCAKITERTMHIYDQGKFLLNLNRVFNLLGSLRHFMRGIFTIIIMGSAKRSVNGLS